MSQQSRREMTCVEGLCFAPVFDWFARRITENVMDEFSSNLWKGYALKHETFIGDDLERSYGETLN